MIWFDNDLQYVQGSNKKPIIGADTDTDIRKYKCSFIDKPARTCFDSDTSIRNTPYITANVSIGICDYWLNELSITT